MRQESMASMERFNAWLDMVESLVWDEVGVSLSDLPDEDYYGMFTDGFTPRDAADYVLTEAGYDTTYLGTVGLSPEDLTF